MRYCTEARCEAVADANECGRRRNYREQTRLVLGRAGNRKCLVARRRRIERNKLSFSFWLIVQLVRQNIFGNDRTFKHRIRAQFGQPSFVGRRRRLRSGRTSTTCDGGSDDISCNCRRRLGRKLRGTIDRWWSGIDDAVVKDGCRDATGAFWIECCRFSCLLQS